MIGRVSELDYSAAEAHWQNGEVESFNKAFRFAAERIIDERQLAGQDEMQTLGIIVSAAMNDKVRTSGASANQWLFRKSADAFRLAGPRGANRSSTRTRTR